MSDTETLPEEEPYFEKLRVERQREVDRLSLELLSNSRHYNKYIAKNNPEEQMRRSDEAHRILKYKSRITALFIELLDEYEDLGETSDLVSSDLQSIFKECVQKAVQHLEWAEYNNHVYDEDDDIMFPEPRKLSKAAEYPYSYWGATIHKHGSK